QGEWLLLVRNPRVGRLVPDPFGRRVRVTGDRIGDTRRGLPLPGHLAIGAIDGFRLELTLHLDDGRSYVPWRVPSACDGAPLHLVGRDILWWEFPRDIGVYDGGLNLRRARD